MKPRLVSILIPAFNEEENIKKVINDTLKLQKQIPLEIIVISDGSTDRTAISAREAGAHKVIENKKNLGKGGAFKKGLQEASGEYLIQIDADYQFLPREIPRFVKELTNGADIVLGTRYEAGSSREEESVNYVRRLGSYFLSFFTSVAAGVIVTDVMAGFKGFQTKSLKSIPFMANDFGYEAEMVIRFAKKDKKIVNVPISYRRRISGKSNVHTFQDGFRVLWQIIISSF